jgi:hypothetical protein
MMTKRFVSSYQGSAEYIVEGVPYEVRTFYNPEAPFVASVRDFAKSEVGTVRAKHYPEATTFPPAAVLALFPGYVAARVGEDYTLRYPEGVAPKTYINPVTGWIEADL